LEPADAEELVREPSEAWGIPLVPVTRKILSVGGRLPFFLQIACSAWFEYLEESGQEAASFTEAEVPRQVLETFREEALPHFEFILESLPAAEAAALRGAVAGAVVDPDDPTVDALVRRGYLELTSDRIAPFSEEFARFLRSSSK
jgi:hypothetical protein